MYDNIWTNAIFPQMGGESFTIPILKPVKEET